MQKPARDSSLTWILLVLAVPVLYVLSVGPAIFVSEKAHLDPRGFEVVYAPLIWMHQRTPLRKPLEAYAEFWEKLAR